MKVIILAGGKGTKFLNTKTIPKPMIKIVRNLFYYILSIIISNTE